MIYQPVQLGEPLWFHTPKGKAHAIFFVYGGAEGDSVWVCAHENGQIWEFSHADVRLYDNVTLGRENPGIEQQVNINQSEVF